MITLFRLGFIDVRPAVMIFLRSIIRFDTKNVTPCAR